MSDVNPDHKLLADIEDLQRQRAEILDALTRKMDALTTGSDKSNAARDGLLSILDEIDILVADLRSMLRPEYRNGTGVAE